MAEEEKQLASESAGSSGAGGFFTIQRRGQGKWTRLGTAMAAVVIIFGLARFLFIDIAAQLQWKERTALIVASVFVVVAAVVAFWLQNKASHVSFLIDTDTEMKKVNWTSRQELIGSTKVVIFFMLLMAFMLFFVDVLFGKFFQLIGVLKFGPFGT